MRITRIVVEVEDDSGKRFECSRGEDQQWRIGGPLYPRILGLLNGIQMIAKQQDRIVAHFEKEEGGAA